MKIEKHEVVQKQHILAEAACMNPHVGKSRSET
jgi:hypothetical protein